MHDWFTVFPCNATSQKTMHIPIEEISPRLIFVVFAALSQLGIQTTSFAAIIGAAGLAVGLALQGSLSNFASGVLILSSNPPKSGTTSWPAAARAW